MPILLACAVLPARAQGNARDGGKAKECVVIQTGVEVNGTVTTRLNVHGKDTTIEHDGRTIFEGLPSPLKVGRYHSLVVDDELPDCLEASARGGGVLMGIRHRELPAEGVQFHPESVLTEQGRELLANFLAIGSTTDPRVALPTTP